MRFRAVTRPAYCLQGVAGDRRVGTLQSDHGYLPRDQSTEDEEIYWELGGHGDCGKRGFGAGAGWIDYTLHDMEMGILDQVSD